MGIFKGIKRRIGNFRSKEKEENKNESKDLDNPRQFIYLDDLSVESLLASKGEGGITSQVTKEKSNEESEELRGDIGGSIGGIGSKVSASKMQRNANRTASVNHFNLVQSQFTRLHNSDRIKFRTLDKESNIEDVERGDILEIEANISVNKLYRTSKTFEYLDDLFPDEIGENHQIRSVMEKLSSLFEDSIPIVGKATSLDMAKNGDIKENYDPDNPLTFVGNLKHELLWTDPANSLYGEEEFIVVCRVKAVKEDENTKSLKISEIIEPLMPKTADSFEEEMEKAVNAMETQISEYDAINTNQGESFLAKYSQELQKRYVEIGKEENKKLLQTTLQESGEFNNQSEKQYKKSLTEEFTDSYEEKTSTTIEPEERLEIREKIRTENSDANTETEGSEKVVESEIIAIYW